MKNRYGFSNLLPCLFLGLTLLMGNNLNAQIPLSGSFTDCNNMSRDIQATLGNGYSLIIAHKGVDCSICQSQASSLESWAVQNKSKVKVWCALTWKYNSNTFSPPCTATQNWVNTYNWTEIFTFPDTARLFVNFATPYYYVYSPRDSSIKYQGNNRSTAYSMAIQESIVGLRETEKNAAIKVSLHHRQLVVESPFQEVGHLRIMDLRGKLITSKQIRKKREMMDLTSLPPSIYLLSVRYADQNHSQKILLE